MVVGVASSFILSPSHASFGQQQFRGMSSTVTATVADDDTVLSASPVATSLSSSASFENFDYESHWYPVSWVRDLQPNQPTKVTVFDVDYVVAKVPQGKDGEGEDVICLEDKCTHKAAALSQGRVSENGKYFQCAYHGWSFDGKSGECVEIPQLVGINESMAGQIPSRSCANAVPAQIHQEMVWIFPGGIEKALKAPPPPTVSELENGDGFKLSPFVRDFPVDWPILVSNIFDPDHGLVSCSLVFFFRQEILFQ